MKCLEKELAKRYATAQMLAEELSRFLEGKPVLARPVGRLAKARRWCRRNPRIAVALGGRWLAAGCGAEDNAVIWDVAAKPELPLLHGHSGWIVDLAFSPDSQTLATACTDQTLRLWDIAPQVPRRKLPAVHR